MEAIAVLTIVDNFALYPLDTVPASVYSTDMQNTTTHRQMGIDLPADISLDREGDTVEVYRQNPQRPDEWVMIGYANGWSESAHIEGKPWMRAKIADLAEAIAYILKNA